MLSFLTVGPFYFMVDLPSYFIKYKNAYLIYILHIRGEINQKVEWSYCVKTEHLLRTPSIPNERYIHKEQKSVSS